MNAVRIDNPAVPFWGTILGNVSPGKSISIKGIFHPAFDKSQYSQINLCEGKKDFIALHISIRFNNREVILNSCKRGHWESEEKGGPFPFEEGSEFWLQIIAQQDAYHISVNGQQCWTFRHRMPFLNVNALNVEGPLQIYQIEFQDQNAMTFQPGGHRPPPPLPRPGVIPGGCIPPTPYQPGAFNPITAFLEPVNNPPIPFTQIISMGIQPGMMFYISGMPSPNFQRFTVNLQCGSAPQPPPDVAFHFDVRAFSASVVRNTRRDNQWGKEEVTSPPFPFQASVPFDMMILVQNDKYMVAVNGQHFVQYNHRLPYFTRINTLRIENDITLTAVRFGRN